MYKHLMFLISMTLLLLAGNATAQIDPASVTDGHVYLFDDVSGIQLQDDSANNSVGTIVGDPQVVAGLKGNALQFDGIDDGVNLPDSDFVNVNAGPFPNRTVVAVFKCDDVDKPEKQTIFEEGGTTRGMVFYINEGLLYAAAWNRAEYMWDGEWLSTPVQSNNWHAVAMVIRDGTEAVEDGKFEMWVDGQLIAIAPGGHLHNHGDDAGIGYTNQNAVFHDGNASPASGHYFGGAIDEVWILNQALTQAELSAFKGKPWPYASGPNPANGAMHEDTWVTLSWRAGPFAVSHDIYMGENFDDVNDATRDSDVFVGNQVEDFLVAGFPGNPIPEGLVPGTTYYWRIDEVNDADPNSPWKGPVWSFSVPPKTAYNPDPTDGAQDVDPNTPVLNWTPGFGAILHTVYLGDDYDTVDTAVGGMPLGAPTHRPGPLELEKVYYWRVDEFDGFGTFKGAVWSFTTPGAVGDPSPAYDATDVGMNAILSWTPSTSAASHQLYFGMDKEAVRIAGPGSPEDKGSKALGAESYDPGLLDADTTYYWRVDEVDAQGNVLKGPIWVFTTGVFLLVDDFESYTDDDANNEAIWQHWIDGFGIADNGSQVGNLLPPYAEQTIVHGGDQSMPLFYTNEGGVTNSEATLTLTTPRDWTLAGVTQLSLWYRGVSSNAADLVYVAVSNSAGAPAIAVNDDPSAATLIRWTQWRIPLQAISDQGISLGNVDKIAVGVGSKGGVAVGGSGTLYVDDIRLY